MFSLRNIVTGLLIALVLSAVVLWSQESVEVFIYSTF
jgi:hypothetical protein